MKMTAFLFLFFLAFNVFANTQLEVLAPVIKLPPPGQKVTAIFFNIANKSKNDLMLVKASGDFAEQFELHAMEMKENMMRMRQVDSILLKKESTTELKSGGLHIMVFDLKNPLQKGKDYDLKLFFNDKSEKIIKIKAVEFN